jgi:hypothetical protein
VVPTLVDSLDGYGDRFRKLGADSNGLADGTRRRADSGLVDVLSVAVARTHQAEQ